MCVCLGGDKRKAGGEGERIGGRVDRREGIGGEWIGGRVDRREGGGGRGDTGGRGEEGHVYRVSL